ncbi:MAG: serine hydrolase [Gammaproteobacteria bacterium]|nr:serine hydrolase [Gammaproteobacteria bacterium]
MVKVLVELMQKHSVFVAGYALIEGGKIVDQQTISLHPKIQVSTESLFQACSLSKPLTAWAILHLVQAGKIDLHQPLNNQLQHWKIPPSEYGEVTISQCLSMTSGLCYGDPNQKIPNYPHDAALPSLRETLDGCLPAINPAIRLGLKPGSRYIYSGAGFMVLQQLIEEKTGQAFAEYMEQVIFQQLRMVKSTFECPLKKWRADAVPGFNALGEMNMDGWDQIPSSASGGLWSTPRDLAECMIHLANAKTMLTRQDHSRFGLGVVIDEVNGVINFRKNGCNAGFQNEMIMFPESGQGIVVMTNSAAGMTLIQEFISYVAAEYHWPAYDHHFNEIAF